MSRVILEDRVSGQAQRRAVSAGERAITLRADSIVLESKLRSEVALEEHAGSAIDLMKEAAELIQKLREALP